LFSVFLDRPTVTSAPCQRPTRGLPRLSISPLRLWRVPPARLLFAGTQVSGLTHPSYPSYPSGPSCASSRRHRIVPPWCIPHILAHEMREICYSTVIHIRRLHHAISPGVHRCTPAHGSPADPADAPASSSPLHFPTSSPHQPPSSAAGRHGRSALGSQLGSEASQGRLGATPGLRRVRGETPLFFPA
jgi:hypothetical protein